VPESDLDRENSGPLPGLRERCVRAGRSMAWLLMAVVTTMLLVTALGIVGLASFWVQQRTRQIGIRRALGARRVDILRYFHVENFLLASFGIALGILLAYAGHPLLMRHFDQDRLPLHVLP